MGAAGAGGVLLTELGCAPACAKLTGAAIATGTSPGGIIAGIEYVSLCVGLFFGLAPTV